MRIRSIKPEFWRSADITAIEDWDARLLFIGLWSYVDDNGVGIDRLATIAADLFAGDLEADSRETFARVSRGLQTLSDLGRITRYIVEGKAYLHVTNWDKHQRIDKPNKPRYPLPTCENVQIRESLATPSRHPRESPATGTEEQGNRGTELSITADAVTERFDEFWQLYPRKVGKGQALKAWKAANKKANPEAIVAGLRAHLPGWAKSEAKFIPHATTWLNGERWADEVEQPQSVPAGWPEGWGPAPKPTGSDTGEWWR